MADLGGVANPTEEFYRCLAVRLCGIDFKYSIVDSASGRELQNQPIHNIAGLGEAAGNRPFRPFAKPMLFLPRSTIRIEVEEISEGSLYGDKVDRRNGAELFIVLHGYKILGYGAGQDEHLSYLRRALGRRLFRYGRHKGRAAKRGGRAGARAVRATSAVLRRPSELCPICRDRRCARPDLVKTQDYEWIILCNNQPRAPYLPTTIIRNPWGQNAFPIHLRLEEGCALRFIVRRTAQTVPPLTQVGGRLQGRYWYNTIYGGAPNRL